MPQTHPNVPPPFDQGVFLMHYNRGREAFQEGRYAEARRELEVAQRLRPDDADVLNLLGLVYFKMGSYSEAEVIYRRLVSENPSVFTLHSNLGLILFKLRKLEESERHLLRAIELRPNYAKSHLYLGMLYRQKGKLGLALEHLRFAGAEKVVREIEQELARQKSPPATEPRQQALVTKPGVAPPSPLTQPIPIERGRPSSESAAASKLQEAVDEPLPSSQRRIDLGQKIEGASRTFTLHENGFLEINFFHSVRVRTGTISSYSGNLKFTPEPGLLGTAAAPLVRAEGQGRLFVYDKGKKTFLLDLHDEFIYVEGSRLLALEESLSWRLEPIYDTTYQQKLDTVKIFGRGSLAISTAIEPLTMRVSGDYPLSISANALVAWTGNLIPSVLDDGDLEGVMIESPSQSFKIRFDGDGVVVSEQ